MKGHIDTFHVRQGHLLLQDHLVQCPDEEGVEEPSMEDGETDDSTDELEVEEMLRVDARMRVDLKRVIVVGRILKEAIKGIEHLVGQQEEELSDRWRKKRLDRQSVVSRSRLPAE